eukprot:3329687-Pleurochrysis_carterae.AAC.3
MTYLKTPTQGQAQAQRAECSTFTPVALSLTACSLLVSHPCCRGKPLFLPPLLVVHVRASLYAEGYGRLCGGQGRFDLRVGS